jgi:predicted transposase/invertase (TIGR01784 family)
MSDLTNPHDKFFKETFTRLEVARDFFAHHLPTAVVETIDLSTLTLQPGSFIDQELQEHFADLLYEVQLSANSDETAYLYLLLEHKSYFDPYTPLQLLRYLLRIWERDAQAQESLRPIVPIVVYHGQETWRVAPNFGSLFSGAESLRPYWPTFQYELLDLVRLPDKLIVGSANVQIALRLLKYISDRRLVQHLPEILLLFRQLAHAESALEYLETVLYYISNAARYLAEPELVVIVQGVLREEGSEAMGTIAEVWMQRGLERGLAQGRAQGWELGKQQGKQEGWQEGREEGEGRPARGAYPWLARCGTRFVSYPFWGFARSGGNRGAGGAGWGSSATIAS